MTNVQRVRALKQQIENLTKEIKGRAEEVAAIQRACPHEWEVVDDPIREPGYTLPGDPPGTMGVDWRGPVHVPAKTTPRWRRTCKLCDYTEHTTCVVEVVLHKPKF